MSSGLDGRRRHRAVPLRIEVGQVRRGDRQRQQDRLHPPRVDREQTIFPVTPNVLYGRMMFRLESAPTGVGPLDVPAGQRPHLRADVPRAVSLRRAAPGHERQHVRRQPADGQLRNARFLRRQRARAATAGSTRTRSSCRSGPGRAPSGSSTAPTNTMRFWLDGAADRQPDRHDTGRAASTSPPTHCGPRPRSTGSTSAGSRTSRTRARTIWIDDVVVSKTKIGCPTP